MVIPHQPVNGLAPEILFFVKKMDAKEFRAEFGEKETHGAIRSWSSAPGHDLFVIEGL
jgi:hypothetical protein